MEEGKLMDPEKTPEGLVKERSHTKAKNFEFQMRLEPAIHHQWLAGKEKDANGFVLHCPTPLQRPVMATCVQWVVGDPEKGTRPFWPMIVQMAMTVIENGDGDGCNYN